MKEDKIKLEVGVKILLKNKEGKYLFLRRNPDKYRDLGNKWDIVGGRINAGKSLLENLKREIKEETKLSLKQKPTLIAAQDIFVSDKHQVVRLTYIGEVNGEPVLSVEHSQYSWLSREDIYNTSRDEFDQAFAELLNKNIV